MNRQSIFGSCRFWIAKNGKLSRETYSYQEACDFIAVNGGLMISRSSTWDVAIASGLYESEEMVRRHIERLHFGEEEE